MADNITEFRIAMDGSGNSPGNVVAVEVHGNRGGVRAQLVNEGHPYYAGITAILGVDEYEVLQALDPALPPSEE